MGINPEELEKMVQRPGMKKAAQNSLERYKTDLSMLSTQNVILPSERPISSSRPKAGHSSALSDRFIKLWQTLRGPELVPEYRFHAVRKWRFDWIHQSSQTAIEIEGNVWFKGAHSSGVGINRDCEKSNAALIEGYSMFRLTSNMLTVAHVMPIIKFIEKRMKLLGEIP